MHRITGCRVELQYLPDQQHVTKLQTMATVRGKVEDLAAVKSAGDILKGTIHLQCSGINLCIPYF